MNVAFWHMKHAAMIAAKDDLKIEEAKVNKFNLHFHMKLFYRYLKQVMIEIISYLLLGYPH